MKTTRLKFVDAIIQATRYNKSFLNKNKLAYYCEKFVEVNKVVTKKIDKIINDANQKFQNDIDLIGAELSSEKEGNILRDDKGKYVFTKENYKKIVDKTTKLTNEYTEKSEALNEEMVECKTPTLERGLVAYESVKDTVSAECFSALNGFVFEVNNEFKEDDLEQLIIE